MKLTIQTDKGPRRIDAHKFAYDIAGERIWFAYHPAIDGNGFDLAITHIESGLKVARIDSVTRIAALGDAARAAKLTLSGLIEKHGAEKVLSVINGAKVRG